MRAHQITIERHLGQPLRGKIIFEIGPGQMLKNARFFGAHNAVTAVDLDNVPSAWDLAAWWDVLRKNGPLRFAKTLARKTVGIDRAFLKEMTRQMPASRKAKIVSLQRDAANSGLKSNSFDCAMSFSVFEHLQEPRRVFQEIKRLLRPGGVSFHILHCYTSDSGAHDVRSFAIERTNYPYWCHLRPDKTQLVNTNAYLNRLRTAEWRQLIADELPGAEVVGLAQWEYPPLVRELNKLRAAGELTEYTDEELMTVCLQISWVKPQGYGSPPLS
jgi:SAM-dependent methyltransferase